MFRCSSTSQYWIRIIVYYLVRIYFRFIFYHEWSLTFDPAQLELDARIKEIDRLKKAAEASAAERSALEQRLRKLEIERTELTVCTPPCIKILTPWGGTFLRYHGFMMSFPLRAWWLSVLSRFRTSTLGSWDTGLFFNSVGAKYIKVR